MEDVAVAGQSVAVHARTQHALRRRLLAGRGLRRSLGIPAGCGNDRVALADRNENDVVNGIGQLPVKAGFEQLLGAHSDRPPEAQLDGDLVGFDREDTGQDEGHDQDAHQEFDDVKTAPQRFGQRLGAGVFRATGRPRGGRLCRFVFVLGFGM